MAGSIPVRPVRAASTKKTLCYRPRAISPGSLRPRGAAELSRLDASTSSFRCGIRFARARAWHPDLFLSLHADALPDKEMRGLSIFTLSAQASDREAAALAISENKADLAGINLTRQPREVGTILMDLVRRQTSNLSIVLARSVVNQLARELVLLEPSQRSADFAVLTAPDIPSVLIELGCLSNPKEVRLLKQRGYQQKLARGLVRAVLAYFAAPAAS